MKTNGRKPSVKKDDLPIQKLEKKEVKTVVDKRPDRFFIVSFILGYKDKGNNNGQIVDTVAIPAVKSYPNKNKLTEQIPPAYKVTKELGFKNISVWNIVINELQEQDYKEFIAIE